MMDNRQRKVCLVAASEMTVKAFLLEQIAALAARYGVTVMVNTTHPGFLAELNISARVVPVPIVRQISLSSDMRALFTLWSFFRHERFDIVHSVTPKAGLLAMLASVLARVPVRIHIFTGQVWVTRKGFSRWLLKAMDRLLAASATHLLADSPSQRQFLIDQGVAPAEKIGVLGKGSISGVDVRRFAPDATAREEVRDGLRIKNAAIVFLYLGRLTRDKGIADLAHAFAGIAARNPHVHLLIVGPDEERMSEGLRKICAGCIERLHLLDFTVAPERYMAAADVFCLPSYREGFGSVLIEAAAGGLPAIGSRIYGITDAIVEDVTGLLFSPGDVTALTEAMYRLVEDGALRRRLAREARTLALEDFSSANLVQAWMDFYRRLP